MDGKPESQVPDPPVGDGSRQGDSPSVASKKGKDRKAEILARRVEPSQRGMKILWPPKDQDADDIELE